MAVGEIRLVIGERIARVENAVAVVEKQAAAEPVGAWSGEYFDPPEAQLIVFRGEGILVDTDLADGFLGGQVAAAEAVDKNRSAVGRRARAGQRLEPIRQLL